MLQSISSLQLLIPMRIYKADIY